MDIRRWPKGKHAAVTITMDNMGEAAEIYRRTWPDGRPVGRHFSVTEALPRMLATLDSYNVRATYFIEGWNARTYPAAIRSVRGAGHEVAYHGWQHEPWSSLEPEEERDLFAKGRSAFQPLGLDLSGFRPPGGVLTEKTPTLLKEQGFSYCSPAGVKAAMREGLVYLPFEWQGIDAYYYSEGFGGLRVAKGDSESVLPPETLVRRVRDLIDNRLETGGYTALLFHPFLENEPERIEAMSEILSYLSGQPRIWCAPCHEIAEWIIGHPQLFGADPELDTTTWSR
jgi:peptidoglycan/xylan/chitin deacetylase (PgdA/CDA1 family)